MNPEVYDETQCIINLIENEYFCPICGLDKEECRHE